MPSVPRRRGPEAMLRLLALLAVLLPLLAGPARAESGYDLWLRYQPVEDAYAAANPVTTLVTGGRSPTLDAAASELRRGLAGLFGEAPPQSPLHQIVVDRLALLTGASGQAPDINAMVSGLAARLKADPHDGEGWQRLIRAYTVLGDKDKAKAALATARKTFAGDAATLAPIDAEAKELKLD